MNLLRTKPRELGTTNMPTLARMRDEMDRVFDRFLRDPFEAMWRPERMSWMPALDVTDTENEIVIKAEVPGMAAKDVNVTLTGNRLTLSGEKEDTKEEKRQGCYINERNFGSFQRIIELPEGVDPEKINAEQTDGVLTVKIGKLKAVKPKHVQVKGHN